MRQCVEGFESNILRNHRANLHQTWNEGVLDEGNSTKGPCLFPMTADIENTSRTLKETGPNSFKLCIKHPFVKGNLHLFR